MSENLSMHSLNIIHQDIVRSNMMEPDILYPAIIHPNTIRSNIMEPSVNINHDSISELSVYSLLEPSL